VAVVDWAKAALEAKSDAAINETVSVLFIIVSSNEFTTAPTTGPQSCSDAGFSSVVNPQRVAARFPNATNAK
jgi:hypothetical protein